MRKPPISKLLVLGGFLAGAAAIILASAPLGYRLGIMPLRIALLTVLRWGAYAGAAAAVASLIGLAMTLRRPRDARRGLVLGVAGTLVLARLIQSLLFGVQSTEPVLMLAVASILAATGLFACLLPAYRATRVDPVSALNRA